ncbi:uncharacterized protein TRAVEDRAFT_43697 [Trametes versicolor FP-101664 SS1]|uniref:uncharacterized protein n=1 Tax=Trametes versicolor (strain FP-101664) TaxID=717944 RepID=UPI00046249E2|nr:uncharacterized protein TRAVEDRAFT_43697 [Trametes versicolor FP-101664 SS1]EIW63401.1 hypothetical protein TRAVEDRAFT_43697 [Trametes versicolor FP-101664 SS1]
MPPEVLMQIFEEVALCIPFDFEDLHRPVAGMVQELSSLVSVCRYWRQVSFGCARLWSHIPAIPDTPDCVYSKLVTPFLLRSGSMPLRMSVTLLEGDNSSMATATALLQNYAHRMQQLYLVYTDNRTNDLSASKLLEAISHPAPLLECLVIAISDRTRFHPYSSMPVLFAGGMANVRALALHAPRSFFPANNLGKLMHVRLSFPHLHLDEKHLIEFLRNAPQIETLWIASTGTFDFHQLSPDLLQSVRLCRLHTTSLTLDPYSAFKLLSYLDAPSCTKLHLPSLSVPLTLMGHDGLYYPVAFHRRLLEGLSRFTSTFHVTSLDIMDYRDKQHDVDCSGTHKGGHYIIADGQRCGLWMMLDPPMAPRLRIQPLPNHRLQALQQSLPLRNITTARLAFSGAHIVLLASMVASLPALTTLVIRFPWVQAGAREPALAAVAEALQLGAAEGMDGCAVPIPAPHLVSLAIEFPVAVSIGELDALVRVTAARVRAGYPLQELVVCAPELSEEELQPFRAHVAAVRLEGTAGALWPLRVDDRWRIKNDYWAMYESDMFEQFPSRWCDNVASQG